MAIALYGLIAKLEPGFGAGLATIGFIVFIASFAKSEAQQQRERLEQLMPAAKPAEAPVVQSSTSRPPSRGRGGDDEIFIDSNGTFEVEVVGESHYQEALERAAGGRSTESAELQVIADLVLEDSNPYDNQAVAVRVGGETVGYLSRNTARDFRSKLAASGLDLRLPIRCEAQIRGGWDRGPSDRGSFGIRLDFSG